MKSTTTRQFWNLFAQLPADVRRQAYKAFELFKSNPSHPALHFELIDRQGGLWSARINDNYRVLGRRGPTEIRWF